MKKLMTLILLSSIFSSGCVSLGNRTFVDWEANSLRTREGVLLTVVGNPRVTCYSVFKYSSNVETPYVIADGYFVRIESGTRILVVDEFGKNYAYVRADGDNYCILRR